MAFLPPDQRELFLPLIDGIHENPPWQTFMRNLVARTHARHGLLVIGAAEAMAGQSPAVRHFTAPRAGEEPPLDVELLARLGLLANGQLRPNRVYALDELLDFSDREQLARQRDRLLGCGIRFGRWLRISADLVDAWVILTREREDFPAQAVASLTAIAPLFASALRARGRLAEQQLRAELAESGLSRIGVGQVALDRDGRIIAADAQAEALLAITEDPSGRPGRRLQLLPETGRRVDQACAVIADGHQDAATVIPLDAQGDRFLLLRRAGLDLQLPGQQPAVIGTVRAAGQADAAAVIATIQAVYGLSPREAALAHAIMRGEKIVAAGARLRLTAETSRNYSKRIYAKTGASGQADLVRLLLEGIAPLA